MFSLSLFKINLFIFTFSKLIIADFLFLHRSAPESEAVVRQLRESASETANASSTPLKPNIPEISWRSSIFTFLYISLTRLYIYNLVKEIYILLVYRSTQLICISDIHMLSWRWQPLWTFCLFDPL